MDKRYLLTPIYGVQDERFLVIHSTALVFIGMSFVCAGLVIFTSFKNKKNSSFFNGWSKCDRFLVYMAVCDILLHLVHCTDHIHMLVIRDHVYPIQLCEFYGFVLYEFAMAQSSLVFSIAINAFLLIKFNVNLKYGSGDWRLLSGVFGVPFLMCILLAVFQKLGPTGTFCGIVGESVVTFISTLPVLLVLIINSVLYTVTWKHIRIAGRRATISLKNQRSQARRSQRAAQNMLLFVTAYLIQWWALPVYGIWQLVGNAPFELLELLAIFTNIGGILNGGVYLIHKKSRVAKVDAICPENDGNGNDRSPPSGQTQCS